jgi:mRNA degradation ribonuclease J1/J2
MVKLTFHGGVNEIGGNKIQIQHGKTQIILDFGLSFAKGKEYYTGFLKNPKAANSSTPCPNPSPKAAWTK